MGYNAFPGNPRQIISKWIHIYHGDIWDPMLFYWTWFRRDIPASM